MDRTEAEEILQSAPFHDFLGLSFADYERGRVVVNVPFRDELVVNQEHGILHGGVLASLLDIAGHYAVLSQAGARVPTADFRIDYLRPATTASMTVTGEVVRMGSNIAVANAELSQGNEAERRTVAVGRGAYGVSHVE